MKAVLIDYGHGGVIGGVYQTQGKQYHFDGGPSIYEGVVNRKIADKLMALLNANNVRFYDVVADAWNNMSGPSNIDVPLATRVARANAAAKRIGPGECVYISIHSDAAGASSRGPGEAARGFSVWTSKGQTKSDVFATVLFAHLTAELGARGFKGRKDETDGDPDQESDFYVLKNTICPAVLSENLFFTNRKEAEFLLSDEGQRVIAEAHLDTILAVLDRSG